MEFSNSSNFQEFVDILLNCENLVSFSFKMNFIKKRDFNK